MKKAHQDEERRIPLGGRSMWPLLAPLVGVVEPTKDLKRGDLAIFMNFSGEGVIFHRVLDCRPGGYITRGDVSKKSDGFIPKHAIVGRINRIEYRGVGFNLPSSGLWARCQRTLGMGWARIAPSLRTRWHRLRKGRA
jgi:hypothetical protein